MHCNRCGVGASCLLNMQVRIGLIEKVILDHKAKGEDGVKHEDIMMEEHYRINKCASG